MRFRAPQLPDLTDADRELIARGERFAELQGQEVYQEYVQALYDRLLHLVMEVAAARTGEEALHGAGSINELLRVIQIVGEHAASGEALRDSFRESYDAIARAQQQAGRDAERRGSFTRGAAVPST